MTRHPDPSESGCRRTLVIFARAPQLGLVKTRLAASLGRDEALRVYRELGSIAAALSRSERWNTTVAFTPDDAEVATRDWLGGAMRYAPQGGGDLGDRMARAIRGALETGAESVVIIGTDCPEISARDVEGAFDALESADVVVGPATDGGYYLVGARANHPALFENMRWSATDTLAVTLERAAAAGLDVHLLEPRSDIDTAEDLEAWKARHRAAAAPTA